MEKNSFKIVCVILFLLIIIGAYFTYKHFKSENVYKEYIPEEEITEEQLRQTIVSLYYKNKETNKLMPEARLLDVKILCNNPYEELVKLLLDNPKSEKLERVIAEGTKLNKAELKGNVVYLDLSKEFIENQKEDLYLENLSIDSIVNTLTELNEVNAVRILIDGEENKEFKDGGIKFNDNFLRKN